MTENQYLEAPVVPACKPLYSLGGSYKRHHMVLLSKLNGRCWGGCEQFRNLKIRVKRSTQIFCLFHSFSHHHCFTFTAFSTSLTVASTFAHIVHCCHHSDSLLISHFLLLTPYLSAPLYINFTPPFIHSSSPHTPSLCCPSDIHPISPFHNRIPW